MAVSHIDFGTAGSMSEDASRLRGGLQGLEASIDRLSKELGTMARMIDGDGTDPAHFVYMRDQYQFVTSAKAKEAWDELNSLMFKLTTNGSVTDVANALSQAFAKFR